jgi:hypothetical protein
VATKTFIACVVVAAAAAFAAPDRARASCAAPAVPAGSYVNVNPDTRSITRMRLDFVCGATRTRNRDGTITVRHGADPHYRLRLWGSCSPRDCAWGGTRGDLGQRGTIFAEYDQSFARRDVMVRPLGGNRVRLSIRSRYEDGRAPRSSTDILRRR